MAKLAELTPEIDWPKFFADTGVPGITDLNVANPDFFKGLQAVFESTDLDTIKTYLRWQLIDSMPEYALPKAHERGGFQFQRSRTARAAAAGGALEAVRERRPMARWARRWARSMLRRNFPPQDKAFTLQMVHDIESAMDKEIETPDVDERPKPSRRQKPSCTWWRIRSAIPITGAIIRALEVVRGDARRQCVAGGGL